VERALNPRDKRSFMYKPSIKLLQYLGIENIKDLPEFNNFNEKLKESLNEQRQENTDEQNNLPC